MKNSDKDMKKIRFICAQPATLYYSWQIEVMLNNFIEIGINLNDVDIVCAIENEVPFEWEILSETYSARFFFYNDTRFRKNYISSIRPNILKQHFLKNLHLKNEVIFYHDCDIIFTKNPNEWITEEMRNDDIWYGSDTVSYIGYDYIKTKGDDVLKLMTNIVGINVKVVKENNLNSIGAQYLLKEINHYFWERVENECETLFHDITNLNDVKISSERKNGLDNQNLKEYKPLQIWCADMWALLWNGWKMGKKTVCHSNFDFSWGNSDKTEFFEKNIFHNAGITDDVSGYFFKSNYTEKLPYNENLKLNEDSASLQYYELIQRVGKKSVLLDENKNSIKNQFKKYKISQLQLDPFGVCNASCWFCPVKYLGNPDSGKEIMSPQLLRKIIENLINERNKPNGLVSKNFGGFYTAHYNEILLYPHFEELLKICQEYDLHFMVLSNGLTLTQKTVDLMNKYKGVVNGICLNVPGFEPEVWSKRSGMDIKHFDKLISNIKYCTEILSDMVDNKSFSIQINGSNENSFTNKGGWIDKGIDFPDDMDLNPLTGELQLQVLLAKKLFPKVQIFEVPSLIDRAGLLDNVITNERAIKQNLMNNNDNKKVIGCGNGIEVGGRPFGWLHVNASGKAFLCCNDYDMKIQFGDFKTQELRDFWGTDYHIQKIEKSFETICRKCTSAVFK